MASRSIFSTLGRRAAAAGAAGASVVANQPAAQAREAVHATARPQPRPAGQQQLYDEDWIEANVYNEVVVFKPFSAAEVDDAVDSVMQALSGAGTSRRATSGRANAAPAGAPPPSVLIQEVVDSSQPHPLQHLGERGRHDEQEEGGTAPPASPPRLSAADSSSAATDAANDVLDEPLAGTWSAGSHMHQHNQMAGVVGAAARMEAAADPHPMMDLMKVASTLLKRPGLQREMFQCMLEDVEVREILMRQSNNIDHYLTAVGIHTPAGLLTDGSSPALQGLGLRSRRPRGNAGGGNEASGAAGYLEQEEEEEEEGGSNPVLQAILDAVSTCINATTSTLAGLGEWFKGRFAALGSLLGKSSVHAPSHGEGLAQYEEQQREGEGEGSGEAVLLAVLAVVAAVFCLLLARRGGRV